MPLSLPLNPECSCANGYVHGAGLLDHEGVVLSRSRGLIPGISIRTSIAKRAQHFCC